MLDSMPPAQGSPSLVLLQRWGRLRLQIDSSTHLPQQPGEMGTGRHMPEANALGPGQRGFHQVAGKEADPDGSAGPQQGEHSVHISCQIDPELPFTVNNSLLSPRGTEQKQSQLQGRSVLPPLPRRRGLWEHRSPQCQAAPMHARPH